MVSMHPLDALLILASPVLEKTAETPEWLPAAALAAGGTGAAALGLHTGIEGKVHPAISIALTGGGLAAGGYGGMMLGLGPHIRKGISNEVHDPRLYSNLRGALSLEDGGERRAAHKELTPGPKDSVLQAMRQGFLREKEAAAKPKKEKRRPWNVANIRSGKRPMSVDTMLRKEKDGTLNVKLAWAKEALVKEAITRAVKEWRGATGAGDLATADQIARASNQLGLKPRYLEDISGGGGEAGVDKMMGAAGGFSPARGPNKDGIIARKLYKPDSVLHGGADTTKILGLKQQYTDAARALSPEAAEMVPAMYSHKELAHPAGILRHTSEHEFVPNMTSLRQEPNALSHIDNLHAKVVKPLAKQQMGMADIARSYKGRIGGNASNVGMTPTGPKLIDFLPQGNGSPVSVLKRESMDLARPASSGSGLRDTMFESSNMNKLRQEVFKPLTAKHMPPALPKVVPTAAQLESTGAAVPAALAKMKGMASSAAKPVSNMMHSALGALRKVGAAELGADLWKIAQQSYNQLVAVTDSTDPGAAPAGKNRPDKISSKDDADVQPKREDSRGFTSTDYGPGFQLSDVAATNLPQERT